MKKTTLLCLALMTTLLLSLASEVDAGKKKGKKEKQSEDPYAEYVWPPPPDTPRIKLEEIAKVWGADAPSYRRGLQLNEKSVPGADEDTVTMSVEATRNAFARSGGVEPADIGALYIGSESHPYAVKPSGTIVAEAIGATPDIHIADFEFACKAGTESMFVAQALVKAGEVKYAVGIGADTSQGAPGDALEYSAAAGAAAFIFGGDDERILAEVVETYS
ncbi:MAG: hypothetical protein ACERKS_13415, partial [Candidatus Bathyarchaeota archaeon]